MNPLDKFIEQVWEQIPDEENLTWLDNIATIKASNSPMGDYGDITRRMFAAGISKQDIARFAKCTAYETAFGILSVLDGDFDVDDEDEAAFFYQVRAIDEESEKSIGTLESMHESLQSADPTGRDMRPAEED